MSQHVTTVRLDDDQLAWVDSLAELVGIKRSAVIRSCIDTMKADYEARMDKIAR
jgi:hypothetical protein